MCPRHGGARYPPPRLNGEGLSALSRLPFDTHDLTQRVYHVHQIALRLHHGVDGLVSHRCFVDNVRILTALDARRCLGVVIQREPALCFGTRHGSPSPIPPAHETLRFAPASHALPTRSHSHSHNSHVCLTRSA